MQPLRGLRRYFSLCLIVVACAACAAGEPKLSDVETTPAFPEVAKITFRGNQEFWGHTLLSAMVTQPRPILNPWKRGESYNPPTLDADLLRLRKFYFDRGFLNTRVRLGKVIEDWEENTVHLEIVIEEGPPTVVSTIDLAGPRPPEIPSNQALLNSLPLRAEKRINKADFDKSKAILMKSMENAGYARAQIIPNTEVNPQTHRAAITFKLLPGERTTFGRLTIRGARQVKERAVRRQMTIREGQIYSGEALSTSVNKVYGLGTFQSVTPRALNRDEAGAPMDIEFDLRERKPRGLEFGIGFSTVDRFRFQTRWIHRNLFGNAERLTLSGKLASFDQNTEARFHLPYFLAPRTTFTQTFFVRNQQEINTDPFGLSDALFTIEDPQPAFDLLSVGGESKVGHELTRSVTGFVGLELSYNDFRNVDPTALSEAGNEAAEDNILLIQFVELDWNSRDNPLNPTRGFLVRGRIGHSNRALLSDVNFVKLEFEARHYHLIWRQLILATRLKLGTIPPYGDSEEIPFNVRFFAGGPGSVRGFAKNRLGPLDAVGNPLGGESLIEGSVELRFPLLFDFSGALFVDFGNVYRDAFTFRLDELRYVVGPGLRYLTPIGPLRLDIGFILDRQTGEDFGRIEFNIGQAF